MTGVPASTYSTYADQTGEDDVTPRQPPPSILRGGKGHLLSGDLGENVHDHLQNGVQEGPLQLFVLGSSVGHFVVLPLLKPLVVGEGDQTQRGLS